MAPLALSHAEWQAFESAVGTFHPPPPFLGLSNSPMFLAQKSLLKMPILYGKWGLAGLF